jgi:hypothetical protein
MNRTTLILLLAPIAAKFLVDLCRTYLLPKLSRGATQLLAMTIGALAAVLATLASGAEFSAQQIALLSAVTLAVNELGKSVRDYASSKLDDIVPLLLLGLLLVATGCASFERNSYRTLAATGASVTTSMRAWADWANAGHATSRQIEAVREAYLKYQASYRVAVDALATYKRAQDRGPWTAAKAALDRDLVDVLHLIALFQGAK